MQNNHDIYLKYCIRLAKRAFPLLKTNPPVGALLVYDNRIIGEGWHGFFGGAHAEVEAIRNVKTEDRPLIEKSTLYVSLEPCNHHGKTPACTNLILSNKIKSVVVGCHDPNPLMAGKSIELLRSNNVRVEVSNQSDLFLDLIRQFAVNQNQKRPYILLKWAESADGFLAKTNQKTKISSVSTDILVHKWRSEFDSIVVGGRTYDIDQPLLTVRNWPGVDPEKYIFCRRQALPAGFKRIGGDIKELKDILHYMYKELHIGSVMVEGGSFTLQQFIEGGLWDEARVIKNSKLRLAEGVRAPTLSGLRTDYFSIDYDDLTFIRNIS